MKKKTRSTTLKERRVADSVRSQKELQSVVNLYKFADEKCQTAIEKAKSGRNVRWGTRTENQLRRSLAALASAAVRHKIAVESLDEGALEKWQQFWSYDDVPTWLMYLHADALGRLN